MFRLYGQKGCPNCADAEKFMRENLLPTDLLIVGNDPLMIAGIKALTGDDKGPVPLLISFIPGKEAVISGFHRDKYVQLADAYRAYVSANAPSVFGAPSQPAKPAPAMADAKELVLEGAS